MSNIQALRRRIVSAKNIKQITKAMEMVAASKMRRAQMQALASRPYARKLQETLMTIASLLTDTSEHALLTSHPEGDDVIVLISTDKSLAGSLNTNLFRGTEELIRSKYSENDPKLVIIGQQARQFARSYAHEVIAEFNRIPDPLSYADSLPISKLLMDGYIDKTYRSVEVIYMDFVSTLVQEIRNVQLLPMKVDWSTLTDDPTQAIDALTEDRADYVFEPDSDSILEWLLPYYVELFIFQVMLEGRASEHSARMVAMKNASDNARDIINDLTLSYNKVRQAAITAELLDNTTASMNMVN